MLNNLVLNSIYFNDYFSGRLSILKHKTSVGKRMRALKEEIGIRKNSWLIVLLKCKDVCLIM